MTNDIYYELQQINRYYSGLEHIFVKFKVHFNEKLDILFPNFRNEVDHNVFNKYYLEILKACPHPKLLAKKRIDWIENTLIGNGIQISRAKSKAKQIKKYCNNCWPGSNEFSIDTEILITYIEEIQKFTELRKSALNKMINLCEDIPLYHQLLSFPGIGNNLACRLVTELDDLERFQNHKQLLAYAGLDPVINQSGKKDYLLVKKEISILESFCF